VDRVPIWRLCGPSCLSVSRHASENDLPVFAPRLNILPSFFLHPLLPASFAQIWLPPPVENGFSEAPSPLAIPSSTRRPRGKIFVLLELPAIPRFAKPRLPVACSLLMDRPNVRNGFTAHLGPGMFRDKVRTYPTKSQIVVPSPTEFTLGVSRPLSFSHFPPETLGPQCHPLRRYLRGPTSIGGDFLCEPTSTGLISLVAIRPQLARAGIFLRAGAKVSEDFPA